MYKKMPRSSRGTVQSGSGFQQQPMGQPAAAHALKAVANNATPMSNLLNFIAFSPIRCGQLSGLNMPPPISPVKMGMDKRPEVAV